ncbi:hypothetical protein OG393_04555 [Streptomyces sp. NBC_01216]|uniref:hypothetical protein n=1 Tax=Streptomyces sp. NBC_01216 TaxID=2903778 RepID=UPI002E0DD8FE|nr:hypothetical protein OG393_04555 [Streptomyces sp. NBC_01216]
MRRAWCFGAGVAMAFAAVAATSGEAVAADEDPAMPDFLGRSLWRVFTTLDHRTRLDVHDVSGRDRRVLWPPSWQVCTQYPSTGVVLDRRATAVIGVVKKGETCPPKVTSARR